MQSIVNAIIYLPAHIPLISHLGQQCRIHCDRRGYRVMGTVHEWKTALQMTRSGAASVIVFARAEHYESDFEPRIEFVGEVTQDLTRQGDLRPRNQRSGDRRSRRPRPAN